MPKCTECRYHCARCDELAGRSIQHGENDMLCWCCIHAVPKLGDSGEYIYGCEWSIDRKIPKGANTISKQTEYTAYDKQGHKIYKRGLTEVIIGCPKFERG